MKMQESYSVIYNQMESIIPDNTPLPKSLSVRGTLYMQP